MAYAEILSSALKPAPGEEHLAALTAGRRDHWARVRRQYFNAGENKTSLRAIERAAFVVVLDDENVFYDPEDPSKLDRWFEFFFKIFTQKMCRAQNLLHGKGHDRWFDKSFNLIISKNGRIGVNMEHSWGLFFVFV